MSEEFVTMVAAMREAQREYFDKPSRAGLAECKRLEAKVDRWLEQHTRELAQLDMWARVMKTDELPGVYNVAHEEPTEETSRA
jgi:hypothetical protein